jgi:5'/3'-nucleotidase SurE
MPAAGSAAALAGVAALCGTGSLDILLTNDDGATATGIRALRARLVAAGHRVTLAAPDRNASGSAMSFNWGPVVVTRDPDDPAVFTIGASPATSVVLAATALYPEGRRPDLVVSGINHGPNSGSLLMLSGTLGAALAGTLLLDPPVPGIAISAEHIDPDAPPDSPANRAQFEAIGTHVARLLEATRGWFCDAGEVTRARTVLNVNYPARPVADLRGTVVAAQGSTTGLQVTFTAATDGEYRAQIATREAGDGRGTDNHWLGRGYATVTPVSGAISDTAVPRANLERRLRRL